MSGALSDRPGRAVDAIIQRGVEAVKISQADEDVVGFFVFAAFWIAVTLVDRISSAR
jgi:hypothetical protein